MVQEVLHIYDEEIYSVDLAIGNLLQGLDEVGHREDTLIVLPLIMVKNTGNMVVLGMDTISTVY